jgi:hypothetical protein
MDKMKNLGGLDRIVRIVLALVLIAAALWMLEGVVAVIALILAGVFVLTAAISVCPLYMPLGLRTCAKK